MADFHPVGKSLSVVRGVGVAVLYGWAMSFSELLVLAVGTVVGLDSDHCTWVSISRSTSFAPGMFRSDG